MSNDYYSYTKKEFEKIAPFYDIVDVLVSGVRRKVANFVNAKDDLKTWRD
jgi:hypothetical protein